MPKIESERIADILRREGLINEEQLKRALEEQRKTGELIGRTLVRLGFLPEKKLLQVISRVRGIPFVDLSSYPIDPEVFKIVPENLARRYFILPLAKADNVLTVATTDPIDLNALDEVGFKTGLVIEPVLSTEEDIRQALDHFYGTKGAIEEVVQTVTEEDLGYAPEEEMSVDILEEKAGEAPIIRVVNLLITQAVRERASDIHIEPLKENVRIRYRIDGVLQERPALPKNLQLGIISRIKVMARLNIAEKRLPQDGRIIIKMGEKDIDLRVSTYPTVFGENVVMRVLDKSSVMMGVEELGLPPQTKEKFRALIHRPNGIILVTGPTGSGKTTTLYAALNEVNSIDKNIITVEDPVEYQIKGIRQSQVNPKAGFTFANALRSILRQDPDIIMVGEIRDLDTARIAVQAALTGHLVFSTLHTNDAPGALTRLVDMGIESYLVASSVIGVIAQRLVRLLCEKCKVSYCPSAVLLKKLGLEGKEKYTFYQAKGCRSCQNLGYKGRIGIFELMLMSERIRNLVIAGTSSSQIKKEAVAEGMSTLFQSALQHVINGKVSVEEMLRVTQEETA